MDEEVNRAEWIKELKGGKAGKTIKMIDNYQDQQFQEIMQSESVNYARMPNIEKMKKFNLSNTFIREQTSLIFQKYADEKAESEVEEPARIRILEPRTLTHFNNLSQKDIDTVFHLNLGIVHKIANNYFRTNKKKFDYDDLFNNGCIGLLHAINTYDITHPSRASFITFAYNIVRSKVSHYIRMNAGLIHIPHTAKEDVRYTFCDYEKLEPTFMDKCDLNEAIETEGDKSHLLKFLENHLSKQELELIDLRFGLTAPPEEENDGLLTYKKLSERYGLSMATMRVRVENIIWKIRSIMKFKGYQTDLQFLTEDSS